MRIFKKTILTILVIIYAIFKGLTVYAEPMSQIENKAPTHFFAWTLVEGEKGFHLDLVGSVSYGPLSEYMQTPLGGAPSSASDKRPKFKELGIDNATIVNLSLSAIMDPHSLYCASHLVDLSGESTLNEELIFHGKQYPAGTRVKSDVQLNWYEIGYQYNIHLGKERVNLNIAPTVAFTLFDFSGELESRGEKNDRSYMKGTPRVGLELEWFPWDRFSIDSKGIGSIPFKHTPHIYTIGLTGKYHMMSKGRLKTLLVAGVEYNQIDYKDSQTKPNHVKADMGPLGLVGAEIRF